MPRLAALAGLAFLALAGPALGRTSPQAHLIGALALPADTRLTFLDARGAPIGYDEFMAKVEAGKASFSIRKDLAAHTATLRIKPAAAAEPQRPRLRVEAGQALPPFALETARGRHLTNASLAGHYTLLSFYFADCLPCIAEVPELNALAQQRADLELLPVTYEPRDVATAFARQRGLRLDSLVDAQAWIDALGVQTYPTLVLVDPRGRLVAATFSTSLGAPGSPRAADIARWVDQHRAP